MRAGEIPTFDLTVSDHKVLVHCTDDLAHYLDKSAKKMDKSANRQNPGTTVGRKSGKDVILNC